MSTTFSGRIDKRREIFIPITFLLLQKNLGAFPARSAGKRAFRSKSSEAPLRFLWAFRYNPWRTQGQTQNCFAILRIH
jgi:hypothetical protein